MEYMEKIELANEGRYTELAAKKKGVKKLKAGLYEMNLGSKKVLLKNGFKIEGIFKSEIIYKKKRFDSYWFGKIL